jgi:pimeloyl-ACP methyl ester carboxylesterase
LRIVIIEVEILAGAFIAAVVLLVVVPLVSHRERLTMSERARARAPGRFIRLREGTTHYMAFGNPSSPPIVLVPGATLSLWVWGDLPQRLADAGYFVLTYDLFGGGFSDRPNAPYDLDFHVGQLNSLLEALHIQTPVTVVSLAFGCLIAGEFANRHSSALNTLAFIAPDGFGVELRGAARWIGVPVLGRILIELLGDTRLLDRLETYSANRSLVGPLRERLAAELPYKGFKRAVSRSVGSMPIHDARDRLYPLTNVCAKRLAVIWGEDDRVTPLPSAATLAAVLSNATVHRLPGTGHLPHMERPAQTLALLLSFLRDGP